MHTVDLLDAAILYARNLGIHVREEWLEGANGGECEIAGERWLFLDLAQGPQERLHVVAECLSAHLLVSTDAAIFEQVELPQELQSILQLRRAA
jgi:hypothetical protein